MSLPESSIPPTLGVQDVSPDDLEEGVLRADFIEGVMDDRNLITFIEKFSHSTVGHENYYNHILRDIFSQPNTGIYCVVLHCEVSRHLIIFFFFSVKCTVG